MNTLWQDFRYGARMLVKHRGFTLVAVFTLALGIGANTAIFSIVNALLLSPLPFENLDRLVAVRQSIPGQGLKATAVSPADFIDWSEQNTVFQEIAAYRIKDITITGSGEPELVRGAYVSAGFFSALKLKTIEGRTLIAEEDQPGRDQVAVLGRGLWQRRYAADPNILGTSIVLNGHSVTVVGIMPVGFDFPFGAEVWMPLALTAQQIDQRGARNLQVLAHLNPGISVKQAQAEMVAITKRLEQQYPQTNTGLGVEVIQLRDQQGDFTRPLLSVLIGMAGFLLLIACANVANLMFARSTTRQKEIAIRAALGASRWRIIRHLLAESFLLSALASTVGLMLAMWAADFIKASLPPDIARFMTGWKEIGIDGRALAFTLGVTVLTTFVFSLLPALHSSRSDLNEDLKEGGRSSSGNSRFKGARRFLVSSEVALALVLLVGAGMMIRGFWRTLNSFESADPDRILTMQTQLPESKYQDRQKVAEFYKRVIEQMQSIPDVQSVSIASNTPLNNSPNPSVEILIEGRPPSQPGERQLADLVVISPGYFKTIGASALSGRDFNEGDGREAPPVALISEIAAHRYWPGENPLGHTIRIGGSNVDQRVFTIVGIVSDVKQAWFDKEIRPQLYLHYAQSPRPKMSFLLRTSADAMGAVPAARSIILDVDRDQPIEDVKTLARLFADETSPFYFAAKLMLIFGALALVLSAVGVYSITSYSVEQRTSEIGIRIALGAKASDVIRLIVGQGIKTVSVGVAIGLLLAIGLSRIMAGALFGIVQLDYSIILAFASILALVAMVSSYIPARRATNIDPIVALKYE